MAASDVNHTYDRMCAISARLPAGDSYLEGSTSGILIDAENGLVLTHASLFYPFIEKIKTEKYHQLLKSGYSNHDIVEHHQKLKLEVLLPSRFHGNEKVVPNGSLIHPVKVLGQVIQEVSSYEKFSAKLKSVFVCKNLRDTLLKLTPRESWQFAEDNALVNNVGSEETKPGKKFNAKKEEICYQLLPYFILLKLQNFVPLEQSSVLSIRLSTSCRVGETVEICATPFGTMSPDVFLNSRSRGIISKLAGRRNILMFTDARCVPGSEGGGVFYCKEGKCSLTAIIIASLCWKSNEWIGLSMACGVSEILESLTTHFVHDVNKEIDYDGTLGYGPGLVPSLIDNIVYVSVGASWGSGIILESSQGIVLTCSHVLKGADIHGVRIQTAKSTEELQCTVLFHSPLKSHFDVALVKTKLGMSQGMTRDVKFGLATEGEVVYVIGHAIFRGTDNALPMVTRGIVSKIVKYNNIPILLQTTCAVHAGASGGGVFNTRGQLVALVVCNSRDTVSGASYPHVNMCVPIETIASTLQQYLRTRDSDVLQSLHIRNSMLSRLWNIGNEDAVNRSQL